MIIIKGINQNNELIYEVKGGSLQHANQIIITDTISRKIVYNKTIKTFATICTLPSDILEYGKTYKLLLVCMDSDNNPIGEEEYYFIHLNNQTNTDKGEYKPTVEYKVGDKILRNGEIETVESGVFGSDIQTPKKISSREIDMEETKDGDVLMGYFEGKPKYANISELNKLRIRIKYFEGATKLKKIVKGNWIDVYANKDVFVPVGERAMIPLGFALELPQGWEGHLAPRSSTFKTWGIIQTNSVGIVDDSYIGDNDQWHMPVYCLQGKDSIPNIDMNKLFPIQGDIEGTWINKGDKIGQFRIMEVMPEIEFEEVESFGNADRGGFGTSGKK